MKIKYAFALLLIAGLAFAIQPAEDWDLGATGKYAQVLEVNYTTEGGNVTEINLTSNISTEKWAGFWGDVTGQLVLAPNNADMFYTWAWDSTDGGEVCAVAAPSGFDWTNVALAAAGAIDTVWGFATGDTDSSANTVADTCSIEVAGTAIPSTACTTNVEGGLESVVVQDGAPVLGVKDGLAFCVNITAGTSLWAETVDYTLLVPTDEEAGTYETYHFWLELN